MNDLQREARNIAKALQNAADDCLLMNLALPFGVMDGEASALLSQAQVMAKKAAAKVRSMIQPLGEWQPHNVK